MPKKLDLKTFRANNNKVVNVDSYKTNKIVVNLSRNLTYMPNIIATRESTFLILDVKKSFKYLQLALIKAPIFPYFDMKSYIWI